ncbi:MAG: putative sulfate exporter family transporter [Acidobacteria bacterium]|nr:MAG: putative sulfate exporter family transporter [Acidobacteriota bacterium]
MNPKVLHPAGRPAEQPLVERPDGGDSIWPGVVVSLGAGLLAMGVQQLLPAVSALLVAILLGVVVSHTSGLAPALRPGMQVASKRLLRWGIVLLGLQLALDEILALGWGILLVVVAVVAAGMVGTVLLGRLLKVDRAPSLLIAAGCSICGAAAVAAVEGTIDREDEDVATAIGLVVIFGTSMILLAPPLLAATGLPVHVQGLIAGASIHEVAQVVAVGGILGGTALTVAVVVKLARVLMLAPVVLAIGLASRRHRPAHATDGVPPLVPLFVAGFLATAAMRTFLPLPQPVLACGQLLQVLLLASAMFALGCGVHVSILRRAGSRAFLLGMLSTVLVISVAVGGVLLVVGP